MVDLITWLNFFTFDVIGDLSFGESPFSCLAAGEYHPWVLATLDGTKEFGFWAAVLWDSGPSGMNAVR